MSKITRLQADNFKKLTVVDIHPGPGVVPIRGRNAQGKSSTLDAIMAALGGKSVMPSKPVRRGEDEGSIRVELDDGVVILRRFTADGKGDSIEVTNAEGFRAPSPQKMLDGLYASVAFDPLAFTRLEAPKQLARLRDLVQLDIDVDAEERAIAADYEKRRDKNREAEREAGRLRDMSVFADAPAEPVDEAAIEGTIAGAVSTNGAIEQRRLRREEMAAGIVRDREEVARINEQIAELEDRRAAFEDRITDREQKLAEAEPLPDPVDITQAQADLRAARQTNAKIDANRQHAAQSQLVDALTKESAALTTAIEGRRAAIAASIARAAMPVPGIGFGEGEVLFNGLPLEQASSAEQLRVSTAIGMATSPKLRVMLVRDGSLLDDEGERILADLAEANDFQLWVEAVDTSGKVGIVLEDGAVVSIDGELAPEPEAIPSARRRKKADREPVIDVEASLYSGRGETFSAELQDDGQRRSILQHPEACDSLLETLGADDQDGDVQPAADLPWDADERTPAEVEKVPTRAPAPSLFD